ncbi:MAG: 50S ribosomal protein L9, partial [Candidatus Omnitrophota bacterium]
MELILLENVARLGSRGDVVHVKDGYARNYLLPAGLAQLNTPGALKKVEKLKVQEEASRQEELREAKVLAERLTSLSCTLRVKAGEEDKLYGSVTPQDIAAALQEEGVSIDRKKIILEEPIKSLGVFQIPIRLHPDVT